MKGKLNPIREENFMLRSILRHPNKNPKVKTELSPVTFGKFRTQVGDEPAYKTACILLDSGASSTIIKIN